MDGQNGASKFLNKYRDYVLFNKNLIISATSAFFASALVSQIHSIYDSSAIINSIVALATEYGVYIPLFAFLFYRDNRHRYVDPSTGRRDSRRLRADVKKLFAAFSISEIIFLVTRAVAHYQFLQGGLEPYQASMGASLIAWAVFFLSINAGVRLTKLFHHRYDDAVAGQDNEK